MTNLSGTAYIAISVHFKYDGIDSPVKCKFPLSFLFIKYSGPS